MRPITASLLALILALWAVGLVTGTPIRHLTQSAPIAIAVALGARRLPIVKWAALAFFLFWLSLQIMVWLYLLGWAGPGTIRFSSVEIALSIIIAFVALVGIASCFGYRSSVGRVPAFGAFVLSGALGAASFLASMAPAIAQR
jgi:hypothetical protein